jgi:hypothetical protein
MLSARQFLVASTTNGLDWLNQTWRAIERANDESARLLLQALCARHLRFGETHGGPSRTRCHFTDHEQKMQKFPIAEGELNFIEQSAICIFQSNRLAAFNSPSNFLAAFWCSLPWSNIRHPLI